MGSKLPVIAVVVVAVLAAFYQLVLGPIIHIGGIFRQVHPLNNKNCTFVPELEGCEAMVHDSNSGLLYLACSRIVHRKDWLTSVGHLNASGKPSDDHVAIYDPSTGKITRLQVEPLRMSPTQQHIYRDATRGLALHGMDVVPSAADPSLLYVYLVNHRTPLHGDAQIVGADSSIEIFSTRAGSSTLKHLATMEHSVILTPNDVVGNPDGMSFYFTNDHSVKVGHWRELETFLALPTTSVGYCHVEHGCKIAAHKLVGVNGIARSPTNDTIYVGSALGKGVYIMEPRADNTLSLSDTISSDGLPMDNLSFDKNGALWAPYFPRALESLKRFKDLNLVASSGAFRFTTNIGPDAYYGKKYNTDRVFEDDGSVAMGSTSVVYMAERKELYLHGIASPHLTICKI